MLAIYERPPIGSEERQFLDYLILSTCEESGMRQQFDRPDDEFVEAIYRLAEMGWLHFECEDVPEDEDEEFTFAIILHGPPEFHAWQN